VESWEAIGMVMSRTLGEVAEDGGEGVMKLWAEGPRTRPFVSLLLIILS
jgi:hypothetical protein